MNSIPILLSFILLGSPAARFSIPGLDEVLKREAEYCQRLEQAALDYVCLEEITERVDRSKDIKLDQAPLDTTTEGVWVRSEARIPAARIKRTLLYDFQFVRKGDRVVETRTLLREDGKKKSEPNAPLKTSNFVYANALLGPVAIFGGRWRDLYDYKVSGEARIAERRCLLVDVTPKDAKSAIRFLFGRVTIDEDTLEILRIEWREDRIGNYEVFKKRGERYGLKPHITVVSEFGVEKNGIRFPSRHRIEEAYLDDKGKKFVRSETSVVYRDFKFFTITVDDIQAR